MTSADAREMGTEPTQFQSGKGFRVAGINEWQGECWSVERVSHALVEDPYCGYSSTRSWYNPTYTGEHIHTYMVTTTIILLYTTVAHRRAHRREEQINAAANVYSHCGHSDALDAGGWYGWRSWIC